MTYSEKLKHPKWQKKRLEILKRNKFRCKKCGDEETTLNVHHLEYNGNPWNVDNDKLVTLCEDCHRYVEENKNSAFEKIKIKKFLIESGNAKFLLASNDGVFGVNIIYEGRIIAFYVKKHLSEFLEMVNDANNYIK